MIVSEEETQAIAQEVKDLLARPKPPLPPLRGQRGAQCAECGADISQFPTVGMWRGAMCVFSPWRCNAHQDLTQ